MNKSKKDLKIIACESVDRNKNKILELADSIASEPELGYKEIKTAGKFTRLLQELGYEYEDHIALTGVIAECKGRNSKVNVSVMGELDAVIVPEHPDANPVTGAVHACGHNAQMASLAGVAIALKDANLMQYLDGNVSLMAVPAEEFVEMEYRKEMRDEGKIYFFGGKQEFIRLGKFDDVDMMIMQHTVRTTDNFRAGAGAYCNGFAGKLVRYIGKAVHAGFAPHEGINALNAAVIGLAAVNAQRETFRDEDHVRVHPIITKGGNLVNIVPEDVRIESYVRASNIQAILESSEKVNRAFKAGGDAVGAKTEIIDIPGYLPYSPCEPLMELMVENLKELVGDNYAQFYCEGFGGASTDAGDVSNILPVLHAYFGGAEGLLHSAGFCISDKELATVTSTKALVMLLIDLLADDAVEAMRVKDSHKPAMTKGEYLKIWGKI